MKRLLIIASLIGSCTHLLQGQYEALPEQQRNALLALPSDMLRVDSLNEWAFLSDDNAQSQKFAEEALKLATRIGYAGGRSDSFIRLGQAAETAGELDEAEMYYRQALHIRNQLGDPRLIAACYYQLASVQQYRGNIDSAIHLLQKGLSIMENQPPHVNTAKMHNSMGVALQQIGRYEEARRQFNMCMAIYSRNPPAPPSDLLQNQRGIAAALLNTGAFLQDVLGLYENAKDTLNKAYNSYIQLKDIIHQAKCLILLGNNAYFTGDLKQALRHYEQALALPEILPNDKAILWKNRGRVYLDQGKFKKALRDFQTSLDTFIFLENNHEIAATRFELGNYYFELGQPEQAATYYQQALDSALQDPLFEGQVLYFFADALDQLGQTEEARAITNRYVQLLEELDSDETRVAFQTMIRDEMEKSRQQRRIMEQDIESVRLKGSIVVAVLALLLLSALFAAYRNRQKRLLAVQKNLSLLREKELETNYARLEGQNEMQQKIGQELHDGVGALLTTLKINLSPVDEILDVLPVEKRRQYGTANKLLDEACAQVRHLSHELSSAVLTKFGLRAQLETLVDVLSHTGLEVEFSTHGLNERLDNKLEINTYRIVQELTTNVLKHARARKISIQVNRFEDIFNIVVEDDGVGFLPNTTGDKQGMGLKNIASRVHDLGGEMRIDSQPGKGTTAVIDISLL